jgi:hypothetical protein
MQRDVTGSTNRLSALRTRFNQITIRTAADCCLSFEKFLNPSVPTFGRKVHCSSGFGIVHAGI